MPHSHPPLPRATDGTVVLYDTRGTRIEPGLPCAYNLSGEVARGTITEVKTRLMYGRERADIRVRLEHDAAGQSQGHISKVGEPNNLLILIHGDTAR